LVAVLLMLQGMVVAPSATGSETTSRLRIVRVGDGRAKRTLITLAQPSSPLEAEDIKQSEQGLLARELVRQALLIAACDELGLATRDEVIGDSLAGDQGEGAELVWVLRASPSSSRLEIRRGKGPDGESLLKDGHLPELHPGAGLLRPLTAALERISRSGFPEALQALGVKGHRHDARPEAPTPEGAMERLETLGFVTNLAAIRDLHHAIRTGGESPARLGALARGYAQLGVLSEFHWSPAHKAFKARALLYAERLVARDPVSPWGSGTERSSPRLSGFQRMPGPTWLAPRSSRRPPRALRPRLGALARGLLRLCPGSAQGRGGGHRRLAALLRMMALEFPTWTALLLSSARDVVQLDPECYRAHDVMCQVGGVSNLHAATTLGPESMSDLFSKSLRGVRPLPPTVSRLLEAFDYADEPHLVEALARAGAAEDDQDEPSWSVLAHLIGETRFVRCFRRLLFLRDFLAAPPTTSGNRCGPWWPGTASRRSCARWPRLLPGTTTRHWAGGSSVLT
jgi:hypothetical protein